MLAVFAINTTVATQLARFRFFRFKSAFSDAPKSKKPAQSVLSGLFLITSLTITYFHTGCSTIIGAKSFHGPVRDGKGWYRLAMLNPCIGNDCQGYRDKPYGQLVSVSLMHYCTSTPDLSTSWSRTTLQGAQGSGKSHLKASFPLRCFQRLSLPNLATRQCHWRDNRYTRDRDQTVSRRFKPSSRTTLNGEQPYPWDRLQPQDVMSRHRGAKLPRRYELLGGISLLSPEYLLSVERWPFHTEPPDHYVLLSYLLDLSEETAPVKLPTMHCPRPGLRAKVRTSNEPGWYFKVGSTRTGVPASKPPTYPTQIGSKSNAKLQ
ncbi:hypothetical protein Lal_00015036 [Lupinus albus]|nr:hypothetical protein Lal_00015036 [Lupinus albus]